MQFKEIIGQDKVVQALYSSVNENRVGHAQLFLGPSGSGSLALALAFAQYIICTAKSNGDSCGTCPSCTKVSKLIHPDLHFSFPVIKKPGSSQNSPPVSTDFINEWRAAVLDNPYLDINDWLQHINAENKQGNITVNECHQILRNLSLKTFESSHKILILWMAEYLKESGNVLLKIIEEPPPNTVIILIAEQDELILNTILSRTQLIKIGRLDDDAVMAMLAAQTGLDQAATSEYAFLADGNFAEALRLYGEQSGEQEKYLQKWMNLWIKPVPGKLLPLIEEIAALGREKQKSLVQYTLHFIRESMAMSVMDQYDPRLKKTEIKGAQYFADRLDHIQAEQISSELNNLHYYISRNAHPKIQFLNSTIRCSKIVHNTTVQTEATQNLYNY